MSKNIPSKCDSKILFLLEISLTICCSLYTLKNVCKYTGIKNKNLFFFSDFKINQTKNFVPLENTYNLSY